MSTVSQVYTAIAAVSAELANAGIAKDRKNQQQGYAFRGIDDVYNALAPILAKHKLCILPCVLERTCEERKNQKGNPLFYVTVHSRFDFVSAVDGSKHEVSTYGEAMDSGDKATNKAMSAAYKYAAMQAFCIPTEGDNDADAHTHEVAPYARSEGEQRRHPTSGANPSTTNSGARSADHSTGRQVDDSATRNEARATSQQLQQLEDWAAVEGMPDTHLKRINQLLRASKQGKLTNAHAQKALDALAKMFNNGEVAP
jgi:hypothetical protein